MAREIFLLFLMEEAAMAALVSEQKELQIREGCGLGFIEVMTRYVLIFDFALFYCTLLTDNGLKMFFYTFWCHGNPCLI